MDVESCYQLGYVVKPHGTRGEVQLMLDVDDPAYYSDIESVFLEINNKLVPFFIENISISKQFAIVKFEDISNLADAEGIKSKSAYLPLAFLPPLKEGQFYYHDLIGYEIVEATLGKLGEVEDIVSLPQHDIMVFTYQGKEVLAPLHQKIIEKIDHTTKTLKVILPDGLMDIYLDS